MGDDANAFGGSSERGGGMNQERFTEMKALFEQNMDFESFREAMKAKRGGENGKMRGHGKKNGFGNKVERSTLKIENGVIKTITSADSEIVEKLQNREARTPRNESVTRTVENIENGIKVTLTSTDPEVVEKIQNKGDHKGRGHRGGKGRGGQRGQR